MKPARLKVFEELQEAEHDLFTLTLDSSILARENPVKQRELEEHCQLLRLQFASFGPDHALKTWPQFFDDVKSGAKNFEVRLNDRNFVEGDILELEKYDPRTSEYLGESLFRRVSYVLYDGSVVGGFGLQDGYVALGLEEYPDALRRY